MCLLWGLKTKTDIPTSSSNANTICIRPIAFLKEKSLGYVQDYIGMFAD